MTPATDTHLPAARIFRFWLPLAGTWLMMAVEGPLLTALIARLAEAKPNLAAFGVAFAVAIIVEAPVIMLMSASTALVRGDGSYRALWRFVLLLNALVTLTMVVVLLPGVWAFLAHDLLRLPDQVARLTHTALLILLPWPAAIGDRRFHQGLLIAAGLTRRVALGTVLRLVTMATTAFVCYRWRLVDGALLGAWALSAGVVVEALASRWMVRGELARLRATPDDRPVPTFGHIREFYVPLAVTSMLSMAMQPVVTFFMGQSRAALESLAVLPVIHGLTFLFRALGISFQEVAIALFGDDGRHYRPLRNFAIGLALATTGGLVLLTWTPAAEFWFGRVAGLSPELAAFAIWPARITSIIPLLSVGLAFQRSLLVFGRRTRPLGWATGTELATIAGTLLLTVVVWDWIGAVAAMTAILVGRTTGMLVLWRPCLTVVDSFSSPPSTQLGHGTVSSARI